MQRVAILLLSTVMLVVILLPPWRLAWASTSTGLGPVTSEATWAGFHSWTYAKERPTIVIAWDGPGKDGHLPLTGTPLVAYDMWAGLLFFSAAGLYIMSRRPRPAAEAVHD